MMATPIAGIASGVVMGQMRTRMGAQVTLQRVELVKAWEASLGETSLTNIQLQSVLNCLHPVPKTHRCGLNGLWAMAESSQLTMIDLP